MPTALEGLEKIVFAVHYSPYCPSPYQVRLCGPGAGVIDHGLSGQPTKDAVGHGKTLEDAGRDALNLLEVARRTCKETRQGAK